MWLKEYSPIQSEQSALLKACIKTGAVEGNKGLETFQLPSTE